MYTRVASINIDKITTILKQNYAAHWTKLEFSFFKYSLKFSVKARIKYLGNHRSGKRNVAQAIPVDCNIRKESINSDYN